ncbi:MAG: sugar transferase [Candidatus Omnitrophica bacterium]|nr:sugar transferase [Candidatus Omnitrophota bacterium]
MKIISRAVLIKCVYICIDIVFVTLAVYLACWLRKETLPFPVNVIDFFNPKSQIHFVFIFWLLAIILINNINGLYQTRRELVESIEIWKVIRSIMDSVVLTVVAIYFFKIQAFPRTVLLLSGLFIIIFLSVWRILKRMFVLFLVSKGYNNFNVLIIGAGKVGSALAQEIDKRKALGLKILGFLDDHVPTGESCHGYKVLGKIADFPIIAQQNFVNTLFITIHHDSQVFLQTLEQAREMRLAVRVVPEGFELTTGEFGKYNIGFIPVLEYFNEGIALRHPGKRIFDVFVGLLLLILLLPLFLVLAIIIKRDSKGPVFYLSRRYGRRGEEFFMYKFRSMVSNADDLQDALKDKNEVDGPIFKIRSDPRVTEFGKFLRKFSIDELPQLINVLKGEMSLVGPRPFPIEQIEKEDLRQLKRLEVKPGITGLWQIRGRSDISFSRLVKWDIWYINNWSFWLDINILVQTIPVVVKGKGAY